MLEIKPICENCGKQLPSGSDDAMICTFECTFCSDCVKNILFNVCPNCGGGFEKRPVRPSGLLEKFPVSQIEYLRPVDKEKFRVLLNRYKGTEPGMR